MFLFSFVFTLCLQTLLLLSVNKLPFQLIDALLLLVLGKSANDNEEDEEDNKLGSHSAISARATRLMHTCTSLHDKINTSTLTLASLLVLTLSLLQLCLQFVFIDTIY